MSFSAKGVAHHKTVTVTMEIELYDQVRDTALKQRRSVSSLLAMAAESFFNQGCATPARRPASSKAKRKAVGK